MYTLSLQVNVEASLVGTCLSLPHPQPPTFQNLQVGVLCLEPRTLAGLAAGLFLLVLWDVGLCFCPVACLPACLTFEGESSLNPGQVLLHFPWLIPCFPIKNKFPCPLVKTLIFQGQIRCPSFHENHLPSGPYECGGASAVFIALFHYLSADNIELCVCVCACVLTLV